MFDIPDEVPRPVKHALQRAFALYWTDDEASAAALRAAVERLLDHFQIATHSQNGNWINLAGRIDIFGKTYPNDKASLHALRNAGNLGAHGSSINEESVLDAMELLEDCLLEILKIREKRRDELRQKLKTLK